MIAEPARRRYRPPQPIDLRATLFPLRRGGLADPSFQVRGGTVWRATRNAAGAVTMSIRPDGDAFEIEAWGPGAEVALDRAPALLGEADDWRGFRPTDPLLRTLWHRMPGLRMCRSEAVVEALVPTVMEQKVIGLEARRGYQRLLNTLGEAAPGPAGLRVPPSAGLLAHTPYWRFHPFAVERRRAETIIRLAAAGPSLERLAELPGEDARARLEALPGLGPWSAASIAMVALGDADAVPVGDYHLPNMVSHALAGEPRGDDTRMLELLEPYRGHRGRVIYLLAASHVQAPRFGPRLALRHLERH